MSNIKDKLDDDIKSFFYDIEKMNHQDKVQTLRNLFEKYLHFNKSDYMMNGYDLNYIISNSKTVLCNKAFPKFLGDSKRKVRQSEYASLCLIESTITFLNKNDCLKKLPKFDYREE